jgi:hypothetical protein
VYKTIENKWEKIKERERHDEKCNEFFEKVIRKKRGKNDPRKRV